MALIITDLVCVECFVSIKLLSLMICSIFNVLSPAQSWLGVSCLLSGHWRFLTSARMLHSNNALHGKTNTNYPLVEPLQHCRGGSAGRDYHTGQRHVERGDFFLQPHLSLSLLHLVSSILHMELQNLGHSLPPSVSQYACTYVCPYSLCQDKSHHILSFLLFSIHIKLSGFIGCTTVQCQVPGSSCSVTVVQWSIVYILLARTTLVLYPNIDLKPNQMIVTTIDWRPHYYNIISVSSSLGITTLFFNIQLHNELIIHHQNVGQAGIQFVLIHHDGQGSFGVMSLSCDSINKK